ncbi:bifunctional DNA primase/polymerase [Pseudomonas sp. NPDC086581]|uniref:bifunctional DNA primase/polymerase n=1 Tax=Pseudomonas sp. NPDC086581 TaxID=3364432 RepID=UPI0038289EC5
MSLPPIAAAASRYIRVLRLALVDIPAGSKGPTVNGWNKPGGYFTDAEAAEVFWTEHPTHNLGVVLAPSGVCSLDVDDKESARQVLWEVLGVDLDALQLVFPTVVGNPERCRVMFRVPEGVELGAHKLTWPNQADPDGSKFRAANQRKASAKKAAEVARKVGDDAAEAEALTAMETAQADAKAVAPFTVFELRAGDVQDVLPPSIHPNTGQPYTWRTPLPESGPIPELPVELLRGWVNWDIVKRDGLACCPWAPKASAPMKAKTAKRPKAAAGEGESPVDAFNRAHDVEQLLESHGYERRGMKWLCPGSTSGIAGITIAEGTLFSHHGSDPLCNGHRNDAFDVFRILDHGGDHNAAVKAAARMLGIARPGRERPPAEPDTVAENPAAAPDQGGEGEGLPWDIEAILKRFALVFGSTSVFDLVGRAVVKWRAFEMLVGKPLAKAWLVCEKKRVVSEHLAKRQEAEARVEAGKPDDVEGMTSTERYVYLDGSQDIWDRKLRERLPAKAVQLALGDGFKLWVNSPWRQVIPAVNLVFDPTMRASPATHINLFEGLPLTPVADLDRCKGIRYLIKHQCNGDKAAEHWVTCWLAYPLQNLGKKMDTALLLHSIFEGSGKSLLLSDVMREVYGMYMATVGQEQLESSWSAWRSSKLYAVFEEVVSRDQRYNSVGRVKHLITGKTVRIESKFINGWEEASFMNAVFLSNELMPWPISENDRRLLVLWPEKTLAEKAQKRVSWELENGGPAAFLQYLLDYDCGDFNEHTKPINTPARQWLVEVSRSGWETFLKQWQGGLLDVPYNVAVASDVYGLYCAWCAATREHGVLTETKFGLFASKHIAKSEGQVHWYDDFSVRQYTRLFVPDLPSGVALGDAKAIGKLVKTFRDAAHAAGWHPEKWERLRGWAQPIATPGRREPEPEPV